MTRIAMQPSGFADQPYDAVIIGAGINGAVSAAALSSPDEPAGGPSMTLIVLGLALWWAAHLFKRLAPEARARLGDPGKGIVAVLLVLSVVMMYFGYGAAKADAAAVRRVVSAVPSITAKGAPVRASNKV